MAQKSHSGSEGIDLHSSRALELLDPAKLHIFTTPTKRIHEGHDVPHFLTSRAYTDIGKWIMQLNLSMCPRLRPDRSIQTWPIDSPDVSFPPPVQSLTKMLEDIEKYIDEAPPDTGPRRFGNISFRKWYGLLEDRVDGLLDKHLPAVVLEAGSRGSEGGEEVRAKDELKAYLLGGFGSAQRLDYGTGHELSFLAFLGGIWKTGGFPAGAEKGATERAIVLGLVEPYLRVIRRLILTYTLEPAGSHGVWGLDDHAFLPYVFGSAQFCPAIAEGDAMPIEGSWAGAPDPGSVAKKEAVQRERGTNMYFAAVGFIYDVKTGPFWEHSPILFDISGIRTGWGKINKGMIKMYNAEVLSKFPVVQHFPFGSLFSWDTDPNAQPPVTTTHVASQPSSHTVSVTGDTGGAPTTRLPPQEGTKAPWATPSNAGPLTTAAPWAAQAPGAAPIATAAPWANTRAPPGGMPSTKAPWASSDTGAGLPTRLPPNQPLGMPPTRAPWAAGPSAGSDGITRAPWAKAPRDPSDNMGR